MINSAEVTFSFVRVIDRRGRLTCTIERRTTFVGENELRGETKSDGRTKVTRELVGPQTTWK